MKRGVRGVWNVKYGVESVKCEVWSGEYDVWRVKCAVESLKCGRKIEDGGQKLPGR